MSLNLENTLNDNRKDIEMNVNDSGQTESMEESLGLLMDSFAHVEFVE